MIRRISRALLAAAAIFSLVGSSTNAFAQSFSEIDQALNYVVSQDQGSWWWYGYKPGSMNGSRVLDRKGYYDANGRFHVSILLIKGYFKYTGNITDSDDGYVIVRFNEKKVTCVSYDSSWGTDCSADGGGVSYVWTALQGWLWEHVISWTFALFGG